MRVIIVDDAMLIRSGLSRLLTEAGVEVVAEVTNARDLLKTVSLERPDVDLVDIRMPPSFTDEGLIAARQIRVNYPETAVVVLSQHLEPRYAERLLADQPGGMGYCSKSACRTSQSWSTP
jgi:serine/threonine-protein kinase